jgi:hypothetical protein
MKRFALGLLLLPLSSGCAATAGAAAAGAVFGAGAAAFDCPSYVTVTIRDPLTGDELCGEPVMATKDGSGHEIRSCSYAPLSDGTWVLRAERSDLSVPESRVDITPSSRCERPVYSIELA